jgi:hypothetical protein
VSSAHGRSGSAPPSTGDRTGTLIRIHPNGFRDVLLSKELIYPEGLTVGPDGAVHVSNCGTCAGKGEVLRVPIS